MQDPRPMSSVDAGTMDVVQMVDPTSSNDNIFPAPSALFPSHAQPQPGWRKAETSWHLNHIQPTLHHHRITYPTIKGQRQAFLIHLIRYVPVLSLNASRRTGSLRRTAKAIRQSVTGTQNERLLDQPYSTDPALLAALRSRNDDCG